MAKRTVLFDRVGWMEGDQARYASRDETVEIPDSEVGRLDALGATGPEGIKTAAPAVAPAGAFTVLTGEQVQEMSVAELRGYLAARPDQATHVAALEAARPEGQRRSSVLALSPSQVVTDQPTVPPSQDDAPSQGRAQTAKR